jgi:hypothetical protein
LLKEYQKNAASYLHGRGANNLRNLYSRVVQYANATKGDGKGNASSDFLTKAPHGKFMSYINFMDANEIVKKENKEAINKNMESTALAYGLNKKQSQQLSELFLDDDLHPISKEQFLFVSDSYVNSVNDELKKRIEAAPKKPYYKWKNWKDKDGNFHRKKIIDHYIHDFSYESLPEEVKKTIEKKLAKDNSTPQKISNVGNVKWSKEYPNLLEDDIKIARVGAAMKYYNIQTGTNRPAKYDVSKVSDEVYDKMMRDYQKTIQNGKELKPLTAIKDAKGNALYNTDENGYSVKTNVPTSPGFQGFLEFVNNDMNNINFYDTKNNSISFYGGSKDGVNKTQALFEETDDIYRQVKIAELVLDRYYNNIGSKDPKQFKLYSTQVSLEDRNKGSMILYPSMDVLKELMSGEDKGLITNEVANAIVTNGISFISNKNNFSNSIFQANKWTPMQTIVNALGSYEYEDPMGGGKLMIEKDPSGLSDYMVNVSFRELMPDGSIKYTTTEVPSVNYQNNIDYAAQITLPYLQKQVEANTSVWNTYMSKGFAPGVSIESPESKLNQ